MIGFDPEDRVEFCLKADEGKPPETRPTFISRLLSVRQVQRISALYAQACVKGTTDEKANALLDQAILMGITGWRNVTDDEGKPLEFSHPEALSAAFTEDAKIWFVLQYPGRITLSEIDLKKSKSRSPSITAASAKTAGGGDASTNPPSKSP